MDLTAPPRYRRVLRRLVALVFLGMILGAGVAVPVTIRAAAPSPAMEPRASEARARALEAEKAADRAAGRMLSSAPPAPRAPDPPRAGTAE